MKKDTFVKCPECKREIQIQRNKTGTVTCPTISCKHLRRNVFRLRKGKIVERMVGSRNG